MQPTFPPLPPPPPRDGSSQGFEALPPFRSRETKAVAALTLGILCLAGTVCGMGLSLGIPAIILGALAHRDIRRSAGAATGGGFATAGIILGTVGSTIFLGWMGIIAFAMLTSNGTSASRSPLLPILPLIEPPVAASVSSSASGRPARGSIVQLHVAAGALRTQLVSQASSAGRAGEDVLVETSLASCDPCGEIERAVTEPEVLSALSKVRVLRVDVGEFRSELAGLRMNEPTVPWFYLLDGRGQPRDAISADEWDDNDAENIAPVLGAFVHGKLQPRRTSWRGRTSL